MTLKEFLEKNKMSMKQAADQLGCHYEYVRRYVNEGVIPSKRRMRQITAWSNGAVQPNDFFAVNDNAEPDDKGAA